MDDNASDIASVSSSSSILNDSPSVEQDGNLQLNADDKQPLTRQKRKRTSPEDQAVLEAAYKRDPKPDRAARLSIVSQVALGEKEVQIWFQNRRQSSRRKARPLLPHEIAQYHMSRAGNTSGIPYTNTQITDSRPSSPLDDLPPTQSFEPSPNTSENVPRNSASLYENRSYGDRLSAESLLHTPRDPVDKLGLANQTVMLSGAPQDFRSSGTSMVSAVHVDSSAVADCTADKRSVISLGQDSFDPPAASKASSGRRLTKSTSLVRLSMNADGKAEVVTKDASSPSPPRTGQTWMMPNVGGLVNGAPPTNLSAVRTLQRSSSGRARDSRSWEFWCDKEARRELGDAAEKDASGSAAGAIGLLRTASGRNVLGSVPSKRNSTLSRPTASVKRPRLNAKQSTLQRSRTSLGRLQGGSEQQVLPKLKCADVASSVRFRSGDSDKENWSPDASFGSSADPRGPSFPAARPERAGRETTSGTSEQKDGLELPRNRGRSFSSIEIADLENDAELAAFVHGGRKNARNSEGDELDCVQGLLSLSQGNWVG